MPAILFGGPPPQRNEHMWQALKIHIMRERQRKKQEREADEEEERLRKERERQKERLQKQHVMTLGETREQIANLRSEVVNLEKEKRNLFTELKRILHEEEHRKRLVKENSVCPEILTLGGYSAMNTKVPHSQLFLPVAQNASPQPYEANVAGPQLLTTGSSKRTLSPPPPATPSYHISYYKPPPCIPNYNLPPPPKSEEPGRRSNDSRAVLWNKNNQYSYYSSTSNQSAYGYPSITSQPSRETTEPSKPTYPTGGRSSLATHQPAYVTNIHSMEQHNAGYGEEKHYLRPNQITVHGIPIQQSAQGAKTGGITTGFPVRTPVIPYQPSPHNPAVTYAGTSNVGTPGRVLYTQHSARYLRDV